MKLVMSILLATFFSVASISQVRDTIHVWQGAVPGETQDKHSAIATYDVKERITRITEVTDPVLVVYEPDAALNNGAGLIVCPGGGYSILAVDLEGYEIAQWLNQLGYTAFVLQYRVPQKREEAMYDLQRAIRLVRSKATTWKMDTDKLGVLGFSAGASLSARASTRYDQQTYQVQDAVDSLSCRPDFAVLIYPAYLDQGENRSLSPELLVDANTPPMFVFATADDAYGNSALVMTTALRDSKVPVALHLLPEGGHGYGLRNGNNAAETWPSLAEKWLNAFVLNE